MPEDESSDLFSKHAEGAIDLIASLQGLGKEFDATSIFAEKLRAAASKQWDLANQLQAAEKSGKATKEQLEKLRASIATNKTETLELERALIKIKDAHAKQEQAVKQATTRYDKMSKSMRETGSFIGKWAPMFGAGTMSMNEASKAVLKYNQSLFNLQRTYKSTGASTKGFNKAFADIQKTTALSQNDFVEFSSTATTVFRGMTPGIDTVSGLAKAFDKRLGPGMQNAREGMSALSSIMQVMPALGNQVAQALSAIGNNAPDAETLSGGAKGAIKLMAAAGRISKEDYKKMNTALTGVTGKQESMLQYNRENAKASQKVADTMLNLGRQLESAFIVANKALNAGLTILSQFPAQILAGVAALKIMGLQMQKNAASAMAMSQAGRVGPMVGGGVGRGGGGRGGRGRRAGRGGRGRGGLLMTGLSLLSFGGLSGGEEEGKSYAKGGIDAAGGRGSRGGRLAGKIGGSFKNAKVGKFAAGAAGRAIGAAGSVATGGILYGVTSALSESAERKSSDDEKIRKTAGKAALTKGATVAASAAAGAAIGSVVPIIGTGIGAVVGGMVGAWGGSKAGEALTDHIFGDEDAPKEMTKDLAKAGEEADNTAEGAKKLGEQIGKGAEAAEDIVLKIIEARENMAFFIDVSNTYTSSLKEQYNLMSAFAGITYDNQANMFAGAQKGIERQKEAIRDFIDVQSGAKDGASDLRQSLETMAGSEVKLPEGLDVILKEFEAIGKIKDSGEKEIAFSAFLDKNSEALIAQVDEFINSEDMQASFELIAKANTEELEKTKKEIEKLTGEKQDKQESTNTKDQERVLELDRQIADLKEKKNKLAEKGNEQEAAMAATLAKVTDLQSQNLSMQRLTNQSTQLTVDSWNKSADAIIDLNSAFERRLSLERSVMEAAQFGMGASLEMMQQQVDMAYELIKVEKQRLAQMEASNIVELKGMKNRNISDKQFKEMLKNAKDGAEAQEIILQNTVAGTDAQQQATEYVKGFQKANGNILEQQKKIYDLTKDIREGYLDAITEMAVNAGEFEKIIGTQEMGVTQLMDAVNKYTDTGQENILNTMKLGGYQSAEDTEAGVGTDVTGKYSAKKGMPILGFNADERRNERLTGYQSAKEKAEAAMRGEGSPSQVPAGMAMNDRYQGALQEEALDPKTFKESTKSGTEEGAEKGVYKGLVKFFTGPKGSPSEGLTSKEYRAQQGGYADGSKDLTGALNIAFRGGDRGRFGEWGVTHGMGERRDPLMGPKFGATLASNVKPSEPLDPTPLVRTPGPMTVEQGPVRPVTSSQADLAYLDQEKAINEVFNERVKISRKNLNQKLKENGYTDKQLTSIKDELDALTDVKEARNLINKYAKKGSDLEKSMSSYLVDSRNAIDDYSSSMESLQKQKTKWDKNQNAVTTALNALSKMPKVDMGPLGDIYASEEPQGTEDGVKKPDSPKDVKEKMRQGIEKVMSSGNNPIDVANVYGKALDNAWERIKLDNKEGLKDPGKAKELMQEARDVAKGYVKSTFGTDLTPEGEKSSYALYRGEKVKDLVRRRGEAKEIYKGEIDRQKALADEKGLSGEERIKAAMQADEQARELAFKGSNYQMTDEDATQVKKESRKQKMEELDNYGRKRRRLVSSYNEAYESNLKEMTGGVDISEFSGITQKEYQRQAQEKAWSEVAEGEGLSVDQFRDRDKDYRKYQIYKSQKEKAEKAERKSRSRRGERLGLKGGLGRTGGSSGRYTTDLSQFPTRSGRKEYDSGASGGIVKSFPVLKTFSDKNVDSPMIKGDRTPSSDYWTTPPRGGVNMAPGSPVSKGTILQESYSPESLGTISPSMGDLANLQVNLDKQTLNKMSEVSDDESTNKSILSEIRQGNKISDVIKKHGIENIKHQKILEKYASDTATIQKKAGELAGATEGKRASEEDVINWEQTRTDASGTYYWGQDALPFGEMEGDVNKEKGTKGLKVKEERKKDIGDFEKSRQDKEEAKKQVEKAQRKLEEHKKMPATFSRSAAIAQAEIAAHASVEKSLKKDLEEAKRQEQEAGKRYEDNKLKLGDTGTQLEKEQFDIVDAKDKVSKIEEEYRKYEEEEAPRRKGRAYKGKRKKKDEERRKEIKARLDKAKEEVEKEQKEYDKAKDQYIETSPEEVEKAKDQYIETSPIGESTGVEEAASVDPVQVEQDKRQSRLQAMRDAVGKQEGKSQEEVLKAIKQQAIAGGNALWEIDNEPGQEGKFEAAVQNIEEAATLNYSQGGKSDNTKAKKALEKSVSESNMNKSTKKVGVGSAAEERGHASSEADQAAFQQAEASGAIADITGAGSSPEQLMAEGSGGGSGGGGSVHVYVQLSEDLQGKMEVQGAIVGELSRGSK